ncbi:MAG: phosphoribosylformylglycinamidine cyclo-ligase [Bacteroidota bacterium]|nr:phosphoribosylformylglycinamidine cyclo-ligase [Bacteroidota bacterium]
MDRYAQAGVNIEAGDEFVRKIKTKVKTTFSKSVLADIGAFGAFYDGKFETLAEPVLVSSVDGVGTKLKIAFLMDKHDTVGQDLVNHCVNDIAVCGARPLFFMDYFATGKLKPSVAESVVDGMVKACKENDCALVGGETAEMPGFYREDEYDIAGMIVGIAEKNKIFDGKKVKPGDILIGLPSTGLHTNGYSLAREVLFERFEIDDYISELQMSIGEALITVHRSYLKSIVLVSSFPEVHAFTHITGGGIVGNVKRVIPKGCIIKIDWTQWQRPAIFTLIQKTGNVPEDDMRKVFNLGVGLVIITSKRGSSKTLEVLREAGEQPFIIGEVVNNQDTIHRQLRKT